MIIVYDPDVIPSKSFVNLAKDHNIHAELIGLQSLIPQQCFSLE